MTYNIHSGVGRDGRYRLDRTIEVIANENPDLVALQEVDNNLGRTLFEDQSQLIGDALGMHYHHCVNRRWADGEFGITTLCRFDMSKKHRHELSYKGRREPRGSLRTDIKLSAKKSLHVFNVHLGLSTRERRYQQQRLLSESILLDSGLSEPVIVLGDFNDRPISVVHERLRAHFNDAFAFNGHVAPATFRWGPLQFRLDHIYLSKHLNAKNAYVVKTPAARIASDHLPVVAVLQSV